MTNLEYLKTLEPMGATLHVRQQGRTLKVSTLFVGGDYFTRVEESVSGWSEHFPGNLDTNEAADLFCELH